MITMCWAADFWRIILTLSLTQSFCPRLRITCYCVCVSRPVVMSFPGTWTLVSFSLKFDLDEQRQAWTVTSHQNHTSERDFSFRIILYWLDAVKTSWYFYSCLNHKTSFFLNTTYTKIYMTLARVWMFLLLPVHLNSSETKNYSVYFRKI